MRIKCIKELQTKHVTFRENEEYDAQKVNENWYCVEAVGIKNEDFNKYFELEKGGLLLAPKLATIKPIRSHNRISGCFIMCSGSPQTSNIEGLMLEVLFNPRLLYGEQETYKWLVLILIYQKHLFLILVLLNVIRYHRGEHIVNEMHS